MRRMVICSLTLVLLGFGCSSNTASDTINYHEVALRKLGFVVRLPDTWNEDPRTADPNGPVDYEEFQVPDSTKKKQKDPVAGIFGFRVVPRIAKNTLADEVAPLKSYIEEAADTEGTFEDTHTTTMGQGSEAVELVWHGTRHGIPETWRYRLGFIKDDLFVVYYLDEDDDMAHWKTAYDLAIASVERR